MSYTESTWTFYIGATSYSAMPKTKPVIQATIRKSSPSGSIVTDLYNVTGAGTYTVTSGWLNTTRSCTLDFGVLTISLPAGSMGSGTCYIKPGILSVADTSSHNVTMKCMPSSATEDFLTTSNLGISISVTVSNKYTESTISANDIEFGEESTVYFSNPRISNLSHRTTWSVVKNGTTLTHTEKTGQGVTSASYTIPVNWSDEGISSTCTITTTTYYQNTAVSGTATQIGDSVTTTITLNTPPQYRPTIGSVTPVLLNAVTAYPGRYIQSKTGVRLQLANVAAPTGATISDILLSMTYNESYTYDSTNEAFVIATQTKSGSNIMTVTAVDSRGRSSYPTSVTIDVQEYVPPSISSVSVYRCDSNNVETDEGTYGYLTAVFSHYPFTLDNISNDLTVNSIYYKVTDPTTQYTAQNNMVSGQGYQIGGGTIATGFQYEVELTATDVVGTVVTATALIETAKYAIHVRSTGNGVAFGKTAERANTVEVHKDWSFWFKGHEALPMVYSGSSAPSNPVAGMVWLKDRNDTAVIKPSTSIAIPGAGNTISYDMPGLTSLHEVVRWNFTDEYSVAQADNIAPVDLTVTTYTDYFSVTNNSNYTSGWKIQPVFAIPALIAISAQT